MFSDPSTSLNLYNQGSLDITPLSTDQLKNYQNDANLKNYSYSMISYLRYNFKNGNKALQNQNIRKAISLSINRSLLSKKVLYLKSDRQVTGFILHGLANSPKGVDFANQQNVKGTLDYNPKLAKKLWAKGLKEIAQKNVSLGLLSSNDDANSNVANQYLKEQLESTLPGLNVGLTSVPSKIKMQREQQSNFDISLDTWGGDFNDPITFLQIPQIGTAYNYGNYHDAEYNDWLNKAENRDANNANKRWDDLINASKRLNITQGVSPLFQDDTYYLQKPSVKGVIHNTAGTQWNYKYASIR